MRTIEQIQRDIDHAVKARDAAQAKLETHLNELLTLRDHVNSIVTQTAVAQFDQAA